MQCHDVYVIVYLTHQAPLTQWHTLDGCGMSVSPHDLSP